MEVFDYLTQMFLAEYFLLDSTAGRFLDEKERKKAFSELARIYCIPENQKLKKLFTETEEEHFRSIADISSYERFCRLLEFGEKSGQDTTLNAEERMILSQKRAALSVKQEILGDDMALTEEDVYTDLLNAAMNGNIDAIGILAFMEYNGICMFCDNESAIKRLRLCAKWNCIFGLLMGIAYDSENKKCYYDRLFTILNNENRKGLFTHICKTGAYEAVPEKDSVAGILEKAFGQGIIKRNVYDRNFAKVAFSQIISNDDKKKLLLNSNSKSRLDACYGIPFDSELHGKFEIDVSVAEDLPLKRDSQVKKILQNLMLSKRGPAEICSPLLVVTSDSFLTDMFCDMLTRALGETPNVLIDAGTLNHNDLAPDRDNIILRKLSETKTVRTVFIIKNCEELEGAMLDDLHNLLDYSYRKKFPLASPCVSLDLSEVVFVLIAQGRDADITDIAPECDTVYSERLSLQEKKTVIKALFARRKEAFGNIGVEMTEEGADYLLCFDTVKLQRIIDGVLKNALFGKSSEIDKDDIKTVCKEQNIVNSKNGFGYVGGDIYA
ncbi:MAG: hypothetical protein IJO68_03270 [Clostridia bacterium]|nr:hypothetical protein [Clostridia bacterium]